MLMSLTGPTQTSPFCSGPYLEPAASTQGDTWGWLTKKKEEQVGGPGKARVPAPPSLLPSAPFPPPHCNPQPSPHPA